MNKNISAADLGIDLKNANEEGLFKWLVASFLMGKRIQADIAVSAYKVIVDKHARDSARKLGHCSHRELVNMLGEAKYTRYDESTAERLSAFAQKIIAEYGGKVTTIHAASGERAEFEKRLQSFNGIGPKTVEIFMREAAQVLY